MSLSGQEKRKAPPNLATLGVRLMARDEEIARLRKLVAQGLAVVEDFLPNIATCVLQDYARLNEFCIEAKKVNGAIKEKKP